jgi:hypothetical protein
VFQQLEKIHMDDLKGWESMAQLERLSRLICLLPATWMVEGSSYQQLQNSEGKVIPRQARPLVVCAAVAALQFAKLGAFYAFVNATFQCSYLGLIRPESGNNPYLFQGSPTDPGAQDFERTSHVGVRWMPLQGFSPV